MIVIAFRHAERLPEPHDALSDAGRARASRLAWMLADAGVTLACRSDAARTGETLAPLAEALGDLRIETIGGASEAHVTGVMAVIEALPDDAVAVIVGHINTVGPILAGLGADPEPEIHPYEFDKLFILFRGPGEARRLLSLHY